MSHRPTAVRQTSDDSTKKRDALPSFGRKDFTQDEFDQAKSAVSDQLGTYKKLATLVGKARSLTHDDRETLFFNDMLRNPVEQQHQRLGPNRSRACEIAALFANLTGVSPRLGPCQLVLSCTPTRPQTTRQMQRHPHRCLVRPGRHAIASHRTAPRGEARTTSAERPWAHNASRRTSEFLR